MILKHIRPNGNNSSWTEAIGCLCNYLENSFFWNRLFIHPLSLILDESKVCLFDVKNIPLNRSTWALLHPTEAKFDLELVLQQLLDMLHLVYAGVVHDE